MSTPNRREIQNQDLGTQIAISASRLIRQIRRAEVHEPHSATTRVLSLLDEVHTATISELAKLDSCSQPTMTGLVQGLVQRGLARRDPHPEDSRAALVSLTDHGRTELAQARQRIGLMVASWFADTGQDVSQLETTAQVLNSLVSPASPSQPAQ